MKYTILITLLLASCAHVGPLPTCPKTIPVILNPGVSLEKGYDEDILAGTREGCKQFYGPESCPAKAYKLAPRDWHVICTVPDAPEPERYHNLHI